MTSALARWLMHSRSAVAVAVVLWLAFLAMIVVSLSAPDQPAPERPAFPGTVEACNLLAYTDATPAEVADWLTDRGHYQSDAAVLQALWHGCTW